jgi:cell division transport system permease protein
MLKRSILEGFKNLIRSFWLSATAISVLTVSLGSVALIASLSTTVNFTVRNLDKLITIRAFLKEDFPEDKIPSLLDNINKISNVDKQKITYFDRDKAKKDLLENNQAVSREFIERQIGSNENLAWRFIELSPKDASSYGQVIQSLRDIKIDNINEIWQDIPRDENFVANINNLNRWVRIIGIVLIIVFATISVLVMANILRITIYSHREEIEIMRLVGATNNYIRLPFVMEGVFYNVFAAIFVTLIFVPSYNSLIPNLESWLGGGNLIPNSSNLVLQIYLTLFFVIFFGIGIGIATSYLAIQRYLKL